MNVFQLLGPAIALVALTVTIVWNIRPAARERTAKHSQVEFIRQREEMKKDRLRLSGLAATLHLAANRELCQVEGTDLLTKQSLLLADPIPLSRIGCEWTSDRVHNDEAILRATKRTLPRHGSGVSYSRYSSAMGDLCQPKSFSDKPSYRLDFLDLCGQHPRASFGECTYFEMIDVAEALAHELSVEVQRNKGGKVKLSRLPLRRQFRKDVLALQHRVVLPSIATLTLVRSASEKDPNIYLHDRSGAAVAISTDLFQVIPAGVFQPAAKMPQGYLDADLDLWRNVMREYAEEMLNMEDFSGEISGRPVNYHEDPFVSLDRGISEGRLTVYCFGLGVDPLTLTAEFLTAAVFDEDLFNAVFPDVADTNAEGTVIKNIPFTKDCVRGLLENKKLAPSGAACIALAWKHRRLLLG